MGINRITFSSSQISIRKNLNSVQRRFQAATIPATTGRRINTLSDDSAAIPRLFDLRDSIKISEQLQRNIGEANIRLSFAENKISQMIEVVKNVKDIAIEANNPGISAGISAELAIQISNYRDEITSLANGTLNGDYIFSGTAIDTQPFAGDPVVFGGNNNTFSVRITTSLTVEANIDGEELMMGTVDIFDVLDDMETAVRAQDPDDIATALGNLETGFDQLISGQAKIGSRLQQIDSIESQVTNESVRFFENLSNLEDVDISESITELVTQESAMRLVFSTSSRILEVLASVRLNL